MSENKPYGGYVGNPDPVLVFIAVLVSVVFSIWQYYSDNKENEKKRRLQDGKTTSHASLAEHTKEFHRKEVIRVDENVYCALGFGLANSIWIEGEDGCIVIDTLETYEMAKEVLQVFQDQFNLGTPTKPIKAIVLTHFHPDHTFGFDIFKNAFPDAKVYTHSTFVKEFESLMNNRAQITYLRSAHQFGNGLPDEHQENSGIGYRLRNEIPPLPASFNIDPTDTFDDKLDINPVKGIDLTLYHAPGETNDQIIAWWPQKRMLFPADNLYRTFPNLYAIRGTSARDTTSWINAIDLMRKLKPNIMVPQHTRPIAGEMVIMDILTSYRDAIQFVRDQTIRYMNKGFLPDEITQVVKLPPHLKEHPFLQEFYGTVEWSSKAIFHQYMGWFSGSATELHPLPPKENAEELVELGGGSKALLQKAKKSFEERKYQWCLQLCDALIEINSETKEAKSMKIKCLRKLAEGETSANGRNYYLTAAMVVEDGHNNRFKLPRPVINHRLQTATLEDIFMTLNVMLDAEKTMNVTESAHFDFTDLDEHFVLEIRKGIVEILKRRPNDQESFDLTVTTTSDVWRGILTNDKSALKANITGGIKCDPSIFGLKRFMEYFDTPK